MNSLFHTHSLVPAHHRSIVLAFSHCSSLAGYNVKIRRVVEAHLGCDLKKKQRYRSWYESDLNMEDHTKVQLHIAIRYPNNGTLSVFAK
jgi:hypothetical protein